MKELVEYIAKAIASHPEDVKVTEEEEDGQIYIRLEVHEDDKGKVIAVSYTHLPLPPIYSV